MRGLLLTIIIFVLLTASCAPGTDAGGSKTDDTGNDSQMIDEAAAELVRFSAGIGAGDPNRQMDADVGIVDMLEAAGNYSVRISSYNIKSIYNDGKIGGLLIDGVFQIQSDIEELNSLSEIVIYMGADGLNFAIVNGEKTEIHNDFLFFVACTRIPEKVAEIDKKYIKSVSKNIEDGVTEYTLSIDGEGLFHSRDLFNLFVISAFMDQTERFEVGDMDYIFSVGEDGVPVSSFIRVAIDPVDEEGNVSSINTEISIFFNGFENVKIEVPEMG